jgi:hypothetical protein
VCHTESDASGADEWAGLPRAHWSLTRMPEATRGIDNYKSRTTSNFIYSLHIKPKKPNIEPSRPRMNVVITPPSVPARTSSLGLGADLCQLCVLGGPSRPATPIYS